MISSMSHGNRWWREASKLSLSTRFMCARKSFSTNFWWRFPPFRVNPSLDRPTVITCRRWAHDTRDLVREPGNLLEYGQSGTFVGHTFKKCDCLIGCRLPSIWHEGTSNFLHSWLQSGHALFVQSLLCHWNNFPRECMVMCQCGVPLSKCNSLDHEHDWLSHTSGCDEGLPKSMIINKRRSQTIGALHQCCLLYTDPQHCLYVLQPTSGCVFSMHPLLSASTSYHIASWCVLRLVLPRNGFCSGHSMLIVILHHCHKPFLASWCFCNGGVHVTFHLTLPPPILFATKSTLRVSCRSPPSFDPFRDRTEWRCSSEDPCTPILLQVCKSLHKVLVILFLPPSVMGLTCQDGLDRSRSWQVPRKHLRGGMEGMVLVSNV